MSGKCKAVKIRGCNNIGKYGVAAKDVKELIKKGCKLLKVRRRVVYGFVGSCQSLPLQGWIGQKVNAGRGTRTLEVARRRIPLLLIRADPLDMYQLRAMITLVKK